MEINLTWDLFVIVFFTVIIAYTFIIGRNQSVKIIISAYIAILTADSIGNLLERYFMGDKPIIRLWETPTGSSSLIILKIVIFILTIVLITTRGKFQINMASSNSTMMRLAQSMAYGVLSAGLITSTVFIYASGASLIQESNLIMNDAVLTIYKQSQLVRLMMNNYNVWFSLPAIAFVVSSFFGNNEEA
ncbi:hypothetical protein HZA44_01080 [Candidatus Peregrinibacteria bacterium]|nr:hypothetical protein [Candidatus Peregrinibacteria bacterium]